jgi:biotin carboxyl carrier protein
MRFTAIVDGAAVEGTLEKTGAEGVVEARIGGRSYRIEVLAVEPFVYWLRLGDRSIEAAVSAAEVVLEGRRFNVEVLDARSAALRARVGAASGGGAGSPLSEVRAPMPGRIVRTLAAPGDAVEAGRGLVVMEAMKMQNEIRAPRAGTVKSIAVREGARVPAGALLATLE